MPGNVGSFKELIENSQDTGLFVDKTLLIQKIIRFKQDLLLITRPRRWGKTINMNMLFHFFVTPEQLRHMASEAYVNQTALLFNDLNIFNPSVNQDVAQAKAHHGKYPVIFVSFALPEGRASKHDTSQADWDSTYSLIVGRIAELFSEFNYVADWLAEKVDVIFNTEFEKGKKRFEKLEGNITQDIMLEINNHALNRTDLSTEQKELELFIRLRNAIPKDQNELDNSINFLAHLLFKIHGQKVYILIDEYDSLINKSFTQPVILQELTKVFSGLFSAFAKPTGIINDHIQNVIFTGILRITKANIFSGLNNLTEQTVLDNELCQYYGFTETELMYLLKKSGKESQEKAVRQWYNGYKMGTETLYNTWSVMKLITYHAFKNYWVDTANPGIIRDIVLNNKGHAINKTLKELIKQGPQGSVTVWMQTSIAMHELRQPENIWSLLLHSGYLTINSAHFDGDKGLYECQARIPNTEIVGIYNSIIREWLSQQPEFNSLWMDVIEQDYESFADTLSTLLKNQYNSPLFARSQDSVEEVYHCLLLMEFNQGLSGEQYALLPEQYTGRGRADILIVDHKHHIVVPVELKNTKNLGSLEKVSAAALQQAITQRYGDDPQYAEYTKHPAIGIGFCGTHLIMRVEGLNEQIVRD